MLIRTAASIARRPPSSIQRAATSTMASVSSPARALSNDARSPHFSEGEDPLKLQSAVDDLLRNQWSLDETAIGVSKTFYFKNFGQTMDFVNLIGIRCKRAKHHPVMTVEYGSVHVAWTTHQPRGLSAKDLDMAQYCDVQAAVMGAVGRNEGAKCESRG